MDFESLAVEYADLNTFNLDTRDTLLRIGDLFNRRTSCHVEDLSLAAISQFKAATLAVAKPVTYNGYLRYLRLLGDYAVSQGYTEKNHFRTARTAPASRPAPKLISDNELYILCSHLADNPKRYEPVWFWGAVVKTLYYTGMRRKQLVNLRRDDIDFDASTICMNMEGSKTRREWSIPIHSHLKSDLQQLISLNEASLCRPLAGNDPIFNVTWHHAKYKPCHRNGDIMPARAITDFFKRVNKSTGLQIGAHKFRHNMATRLCNPASGGSPDIFATQALLGHTSIQTTQGYVRTSLTRLQHVIDGLEMPLLAQKAFMRDTNNVICTKEEGV